MSKVSSHIVKRSGNSYRALRYGQWYTKIDKIFEIANNAIYFNDRSDYLTALRQICHVIKPDDETIGEVCIE